MHAPVHRLNCVHVYIYIYVYSDIHVCIHIYIYIYIFEHVASWCCCKVLMNLLPLEYRLLGHGLI